MTKKFICVQGSPEIPKGTIAQQDDGYNLLNMYVGSERIGSLCMSQVEGNECWEEVREEMIEFTAEQIQSTMDINITPDKQSIAQECYNQCLVVECGEGECAEAIATRFPKLVNRIEVQEETKGEEKPTRWKPEKGQPWYYITEEGDIGYNMSGYWDDESESRMEHQWKSNNVFQTEQDARNEVKRRESIANAWRPKDGQLCWLWAFKFNKTIKCAYDQYYNADCYIGAVHPTEEACLDWGETYAKYFLPKTE